MCLFILLLPILGLVLICYALRMWVWKRSRHLNPHLYIENAARTKNINIGFFHPYCNAGGGGERVLWTAIRALHKKYSNVNCIVYSGDNATSEEIIAKVKQRFNIVFERDIYFVFLKKRSWVEAAPYPYFTMLGQSIGSVVLGLEALFKFVPDIYLDTMGYAFTIPLFKFIGGSTVGCYVHYPTISTDMLEMVSNRACSYNNESFISRSPVLSYGKLIYYRIFAFAYGMAGSTSQVIMVNSTWTKNHIVSLWKAPNRTFIIFPPCDTKEFTSLKLKDKAKINPKSIVSVAQFRPEKDHALQVKSFHSFLQQIPADQWTGYKLVLIGSCRDSSDAERVEALKQLCKDLEVSDLVEFRINVTFNELKQSLSEATVGLHTMWNEHFGIGVVELMAAGTVTLAHKSGGPLMDIVVDYKGKRTGFLADSVESYASAITEIFGLKNDQQSDIVNNARSSVNRFSENCFETGFLETTAGLLQFCSSS